MSPKDQNSFTYDELISCARGHMFGSGNPQLPLPPMLMCDRITNIDANGGAFGKGQSTPNLILIPFVVFPAILRATLLCPLSWYGCVMAVSWLFLGWSGAWPRKGAFGWRSKFTGQILPSNKLVAFRLEMKRVIMRRLVAGIADGKVLCDGEVVFEANMFALAHSPPKEIDDYAPCCNNRNWNCIVDWK